MLSALFALSCTGLAQADAATAGKNVLWLPLGDSITWGCTGPTIQDCHGYKAGTVRTVTSPLKLHVSFCHPLHPPTNRFDMCWAPAPPPPPCRREAAVIGSLWRLHYRNLHAAAALCLEEAGTSVQWGPLPLALRILQSSGTSTRDTQGGLSTWLTRF
jgi:hypothetical protein